MDARRIIAAAIIAVATAACGSATFVQDDGDRTIPIAPPTDTAGFIPPPMGM